MYRTFHSAAEVVAVEKEDNIPATKVEAIVAAFETGLIDSMTVRTPKPYPDKRGPNCCCGFDPQQGRIEDLRCPNHGFLM